MDWSRTKEATMKKIIHVNQHIIRDNRKNDTRKPPLTCKTSKDNIYAKDIIIDGPCRIRYSPDKPLSCGAHVWIETESEITVVGKAQKWSDL